jgi:ABC-2 type transport system ATP-binding protein
MNELAIDITGLGKSFRGRTVLHHVELTVKKGSVFGLLGPNGAGKTTLLRMLLGLVHLDFGSVTVLGYDPRRDAQAVRERVGVLLETDGLYERLTAWDNLDYFGRIYRMPQPARHARIEELLRGLDLWERRKERVVTWSKGMRQRLAVARALLHRPQLVLLDEPFTGMDPVAAADLRVSLVTLARQQELTILLTTHDLSHVEKACDRIALIREGRILATGSPQELSSRGNTVEVRIVGDGLESALAQLQRESVVVSYNVDNREARVTCLREQRPRLAQELAMRGVIPEELHTLTSSLEDTFIAMMRPSERKESAL